MVDVELTGAQPTAGLAALSHLYGFAGSAARFSVEHIETLKQADNLLANRCGQVLEAANVGFGVGQETALVLIGVGQGLLGNPLTGGAAAAGIGNPIVMTCAAIGAVHYGWKAMSDDERMVLLATVARPSGWALSSSARSRPSPSSSSSGSCRPRTSPSCAGW